jgi:phosphoribosylamine--glycine ligase
VRILILGSGGREHAIVRSLALEGGHALAAAPGTPGIAALAECHAIDAADPVAVVNLARAFDAELVVVGPEAPLVAGVADALIAAGIAVFGPTAAAARLEGSKAFAKEVMAAAGVPTAASRVCRSVADVDAALDLFGSSGNPYVVKDDGLAAGKGVVVTLSRDEALSHGAAVLGAGGPVVIEEYLDGPEISFFCICDGRTVVPLVPAQDFKRVFDGDLGPNTGGMGAYSPLPWAHDGLVGEVVATIAQPVIDEMARRGTPFAGVLFAGLAVTSRGVRVVEFNARFGDPETQVVLARLRSPLSVLLTAAAAGTLAALPPLAWSGDAAVNVVVAAQGYPGTVRSGDLVTGIADAETESGVHVLHAGTARGPDGSLVSAGGRVLSVVATGVSLAEARERAYAGVGHIRLDGSQHRTDIALSAAAEG